MTIAISEILKQVELLSAAEQEELTHKLLERARQRRVPQPQNGQNGQTPVTPSSPPTHATIAHQDDEEAEDDFIPEVFSLNRVPPKRTYMARAKFHYVGRGKPLPYELDDDLLDEDKSREGEAS